MGAFFSDWGGLAIAILGGAIAAALCCAGSARGCGTAGEAGTGLLSEDPSSFGKVMIIQVIPGTQGLYGFLVAFLLLVQIGIMGGSPLELTTAQGMMYFAACLPMAILGLVSAMQQANCSVASIGLVAKKPDQFGKAMIFPAMVETYAILALLVSILSIFGVAAL